MTWETYENDNEDKTVNQNEFCTFLKNKPEVVEITEISDLLENKYKKNDKSPGYYFYVYFTSETFKEPVRVTYTGRVDDNGILLIPLGHKLHRIASYFSGFDSHIKIPFEDLASELVGKSFKATAKRKTINDTVYYIITPLLKKENETSEK